MKKIIILALSLVLCACVLLSCADDTEKKLPTEPDATIFEFIDVFYQYDLSPYIELSSDDYLGIELTRIDENISDDDLNNAIYSKLYEKATFEDVNDQRGAELGDSLIIDFKGSIDGEYFEGGEAAGVELILGDGGFIPGFEEAIVGHYLNEEFNIDVTFPEDYGNVDYAGKPAVFEIKISSIKAPVLPEFNLDFVKENSDCETVEQYLAVVTEELTNEKINQVKSVYINEAFNKIYSSVKINKFPDVEYKYYYDDFVSFYESQAKVYGMDLKDYITASGITQEEFDLYAYSNADNMVKQDLIIYSIANNEGLLNTITKKDYDEYLLELAKNDEMEPSEFESQYGREKIWNALVAEKTLEYVVEKAVFVEPENVESTDALVDVTEETVE